MEKEENKKKAGQEYVKKYLKKEQTEIGKLICPLMSWKQPAIIYCVGLKCACWNRDKRKCGVVK